MSLFWFKLRGQLMARLQGRGDLPEPARRNLEAAQGLKSSAPLDQCDFVVLDLETTGIDITKDRVISVGAVRINQGRIHLGKAFSERINPGPDMPTKAVTVHGITPDMLAAARPEAEVFDEFIDYIGHGIIVAHNAGFDLHFLNRHMRERYGLRLHNLVIDTVLLCKRFILPSDPFGISRHIERCRLDALAEHFGIAQPERHIASGDALVTAMIFQRIISLMEQKGAATLGRLTAAGRMTNAPL